MADFLFVSQEMLDNWMMQDKIDFSGSVLIIRGDSRRYGLEPAVRFVKVSGDGPDPQGLIGKVKTLDQVAEAGGEHYADSVILGDTPYDVQNGFLAKVHLPADAAPPPEAVAEVHGAPPPPAGKAAEAPAAPPPEASAPEAPAPAPEVKPAEAEAPAEEAEGDDEDMLARFLLDNLR